MNELSTNIIHKINKNIGVTHNDDSLFGQKHVLAVLRAGVSEADKSRFTSRCQLKENMNF